MQKVRFVQRVRRPDGSVSLYFRRADYREGPLVAPDGTPELQEEVDAILRRLAAAEVAAVPRAGTVGAMLKRYNKSADFLALARSTQRGYQRLIDEIDADAGDVRLGEITAQWVRDMRDAWAPRGYKATNDRLQVLKNALADAIDDERIPSDPFARLKKARRPHDAEEAHPIWDEAVTAAAIELAIALKAPGLARAIGLARWGGFRRGTVCKIPISARVIGHDDQGRPHRRLLWTTEKKKVLADKPEDARLTALLARTDALAGQGKVAPFTIAYNRRGEPWKERQLNQAMDRLTARLVLVGKAPGTINAEGVASSTLTIHGLRHSRGVELALAGASDGEIMSQLDHATDRAAKIYRRQADRRKMADSAQRRVDGVVKLRNRKALGWA